MIKNQLNELQKRSSALYHSSSVKKMKRNGSLEKSSVKSEALRSRQNGESPLSPALFSSSKKPIFVPKVSSVDAITQNGSSESTKDAVSSNVSSTPYSGQFECETETLFTD